MISPISYRVNNPITFGAKKTVFNDSIKVSDRLDENGYGCSESKYYNFLLSEVEELRQASKNNDPVNIHEEVGDVLFDTIMLAKYYGVNPQKALEDTNKKLSKRLETAQKLAPKPLNEYSPAMRLKFWQWAKADLKQKQS